MKIKSRKIKDLCNPQNLHPSKICMYMVYVYINYGFLATPINLIIITVFVLQYHIVIYMYVLCISHLYSLQNCNYVLVMLVNRIINKYIDHTAALLYINCYMTDYRWTYRIEGNFGGCKL